MKVGGALSSKMQASSSGCRYPWQPPPGAVTLRNSVKIYSPTSIITYTSKEGEKRERQTAAQSHDL